MFFFLWPVGPFRRHGTTKANITLQYIETASKSVTSISDQTIDWMYLKNLDPDSDSGGIYLQVAVPETNEMTDPQICAHACMFVPL